MFEYECEVFYEDTDMGGRVYYANYLKYIERGRSKLLEFLGLDQNKLLFEDKKYFVVKNLVANYLKPAFFGDKLLVCTSLVLMRKASMTLKQDLLCDGKKLFECHVQLALLNSKGRPNKLPRDVVIGLNRFFCGP